MTKSEEPWKSVCTEMLFKIIREIHQAKEEFCKTVTLQEYMIDSDDPAAFINEDRLFHASSIAKILNEGKPYIISADERGSNQLNAARVSHLKEYTHWGKLSSTTALMLASESYFYFCLHKLMPFCYRHTKGTMDPYSKAESTSSHRNATSSCRYGTKNGRDSTSSHRYGPSNYRDSANGPDD